LLLPEQVRVQAGTKVKSSTGLMVNEFNGPWDCFVKTLRREGFTALYKVRHAIFLVVVRKNYLSRKNHPNPAFGVGFAYRQGLPSPMVGSAMEVASMFLVYNAAKEALMDPETKQISLPRVCLAGSVAGNKLTFLSAL